MIGHYLVLGVRHLRRSPILTSLMVVTLAVGVVASMSTLTILHTMSGDPIPDKSDRLFTPLVDLRPVDIPDTSIEPPDQLAYRDAIALRDARRAPRQTLLYGIGPAIAAGQAGQPPFSTEGVAVDADFFAMFDVPFVAGAPWRPADDAGAARVAVLRQKLAARVFGAADPVGRTIRIGEADYQVTGVIADEWKPLPKFYRLIGGPTWDHEDVFLPFSAAIAAEMDNQGSTNCYSSGNTDDAGFAGLLKSECVWLSMWVELDAAGDADAYRDFLAGYVAEQRKLGRFPRPDNQRLYDVMNWLAINEVVSDDSRLQVYLAFGFLLVCLVNVVGLLLAKLNARAGEIGVRRALGASRPTLFAQYLIEVGVIGLVGGGVGLVLTLGALALIRRQSEALAQLARMDVAMLATTFAVAIGASLLAGLFPVLRATRVQPALQLKSQ